MLLAKRMEILENLLLTDYLKQELWLLCFTGRFTPLIADKLNAQDLYLIMKWIYEDVPVSDNVLGRLYAVIEDEMGKAEKELFSN